MTKKSKAAVVNSQAIPLDPPKVLEKALASLEEALGGREAVTDSLALANLNGEETTVLHLLSDPANAKRSLAWICGGAGITIGKLLELFSKGDFAEAYVKAMRKVYRALPAVAEDVMARSLPKFLPCMPCMGEGRIAVKSKDAAGQEVVELKLCGNCAGAGKREVEPDLERQKIALQMGGLLKQGAGVVVNNTQNTNNAPTMVVLRTTPDFRTATDRLLYPHREKALPPAPDAENFITAPIEAEVVEAASNVLTEDNLGSNK